MTIVVTTSAPTGETSRVPSNPAGFGLAQRAPRRPRAPGQPVVDAIDAVALVDASRTR